MLVSTITNPIPSNIKFDSPSGIYLAGDEHQFYITDMYSNSVYVVDIAQSSITSLFKSERSILRNRITHPSDIYLDRYGFLYISYSKGVVRIKTAKAGSSGNMITWIGGKRQGYKDGSFDKCLFNQPSGMCMLDENTLLVVKKMILSSYFLLTSR